MRRHIDWDKFSADVRAKWPTPTHLKRDVPMAQSTLMSAYHDRPVGASPMLRICEAMGVNPTQYLEGTA